MNKILKYSLILIMILSLLTNVWLLFAIVVIDSDWEHAYEKNDIGWCEISNDWLDLSNELISQLQYYDEIYNEFDLVEEIDCWETEDEFP